MYGTFSLSSLIEHNQRQSWKKERKSRKLWRKEYSPLTLVQYNHTTASILCLHHCTLFSGILTEPMQNKSLTFNWSKDIKYWFQHYDGSQKQKINFIWKSIFNSAKQRSYLLAQINQLLIIIFVIIIIRHKHQHHNTDNDRLRLTGKEKVTCANEILPLRLWLVRLTEIKCICSSDKTTDMQDESICILTCCSSSCCSLNIFVEHQKYS